jgi:AcrR family transcriptional regulator
MARTRDPDFLNRLAHAGMQVFARKGLKRARMSDVALVMGVSHGTLYNYVESKEALFYLLVDWGMRGEPLELPKELPIAAPSRAEVLRRLEEQIAEQVQLPHLDRALEADDPEGSGREELKSVLEELYDLISATRESADVIERSSVDIPEIYALYYIKVRHSVFERFARYVERRAASGHFRDYPDSATAARVAVETITFFARRRHRDPDPHPANDATVRRTVVEMLVESLLHDS